MSPVKEITQQLLRCDVVAVCDEAHRLARTQFFGQSCCLFHCILVFI